MSENADKAPKNILFIMCDQLRWDYLSCYGHPTLKTPNIDRLAQHGVRFDNAYCQAPLCGPSRTSFYCGRYQSSHGVMANQDATRIDEKMMADYLRPLGYRCAVVGKTHNRKDAKTLAALGIDLGSDYALASQTGGFEPYEHHEGLYPDPVLPESLPYNDYLRSEGYNGFNPWHEWANSGETASGESASGWYLKNSIYPRKLHGPPIGPSILSMNKNPNSPGACTFPTSSRTGLSSHQRPTIRYSELTMFYP